MIERIKTISLWLLIMLSVFLTYQIWTFQPKYAALKNTEYLAHAQIGEEKKLQQIIKPKQVVFHMDNEIFIPKNQIAYFDYFLQRHKGANFINYFPISNPVPFLSKEKTAIEFIFPEEIPIETFNEMFEIKSKEQYYIKSVERVLFYIQEGHEQVQVSIRSTDEDTTVNVSTDISVAKLLEGFETENERLEVLLYELPPSNSKIPHFVYLPEKKIEVDSLTYLTKSVPSELVKQSLFSVPNIVKHYRQSNGEESFTDGNSMVNIIGNGNILRYSNPSYGENLDRNNKHILLTSIEFLNGHGGLTNDFFFDKINNLGANEEIAFRLHIEGIPIFDSNLSFESNLYELILNREEGNQIETYVRPLFVIENKPIHISQSMELPSGSEVIGMVESMEDYDAHLIKDIRIGYLMIKRQSFIIFDPRWFINYNDRWEVLALGESDVSIREEFMYGLE